jgi:hypothetical protein
MTKLEQLHQMLTPISYGKEYSFEDIKNEYKTLPNRLGAFTLDSSMTFTVEKSDYHYYDRNKKPEELVIDKLCDLLFQEQNTNQFLEYKVAKTDRSYHSSYDNNKGKQVSFNIDTEKAVPFLIDELKVNEDDFLKIAINYAINGGNKNTQFTGFKKYLKKALADKNLDFVLNMVDFSHINDGGYLSNYRINGLKQFLFLIRDNFEAEQEKALKFVKTLSQTTSHYFKEGTKGGAWFKDYLVSLGDKKEELVFVLPHETKHEVTEKFYIKHNVVNEYFFEKGQNITYKSLITKIIPDVIFTNDCFFVSAANKDELDTKLSKFEKILTFILEEVKPFSIQKRIRYVQEKYVQMSDSQFNILAEKILFESRIKDEKENLDSQIEEPVKKTRMKI